MTQWLIRRLIQNPNDTANPRVRAAYGTLGSVTGVVVNVLLSALKFFLGLISGSLAITADAVNNLSDAAGSIMALISVRLAGKPDDREHPFGHGRMEYIGALAVGVLIVLAGGKLFWEGINAIVYPAALVVGLPVLLLLPVSILAKLWLYFYYRFIARTIDSQTLRAAAKDSMSDVAATGAVLLSIVLQKLFDVRIDGYMSVLVALFVLKTGLSVCKDTIDRLLGEKPNPKLTRSIQQKLLAYDGISGVHDLGSARLRARALHRVRTRGGKRNGGHCSRA